MSLLDKLHDKALSATKKHVKYPLLIASGIADWFAGTYGEIKGHGEAAKASEDKKDYTLYEEGIKGAAFGEAGAYAAAVYTGNKAVALPLAADLLVRAINGSISVNRVPKRVKENPDAEYDVDLTGAIGTARTLAYKLANRRRRSGAEPVVGGDTEETPLIFPDPLPDPIYKDDEMRILEEKPGLEDEVSDAGVEEPEDVLPFDPAPIPAIAEELPPGSFAPKSCPEPLRLPGPGEGYELPDIMDPEDKPIPEPVPVEPEGEGALSEAPQAPSSKPKVDIGPLSTLPDDEDPLGSADEEETGNKLF